MTNGAQLLEPGEDDRIGIRGDEDLERARACRRHDGSGERSVAAARDREVRSGVGVHEPRSLCDLEVEQNAEQVARLV